MLYNCNKIGKSAGKVAMNFHCIALQFHAFRTAKPTLLSSKMNEYKIVINIPWKAYVKRLDVIVMYVIRVGAYRMEKERSEEQLYSVAGIRME